MKCSLAVALLLFSSTTSATPIIDSIPHDDVESSLVDDISIIPKASMSGGILEDARANINPIDIAPFGPIISPFPQYSVLDALSDLSEIAVFEVLFVAISAGSLRALTNGWREHTHRHSHHRTITL